MKWKSDEVIFLKKYYPTHGTNFCSLKLNISIKQIANKVSSLKLKINEDTKKKIYSKSNKLKWKNYKKADNKYKINPNIFKNVNTKEKAYSLGFMWGDGTIYNKNYIYKIYICNNISVDIDEIKHIFYTIGDWNEYTRKRKNRKKQTEIMTNNKKMFEFLKTMDYKNKLLSPDKILSIIPDDLKNYFFLGYSDADGCFYLNKKHSMFQFTITSGLKQDWNMMIDLYERLGLKYNFSNIENKLRSYSQIRITNKKDVIKIAKYLYKTYETDHIGLYRKYEKMKNLI